MHPLVIYNEFKFHSHLKNIPPFKYFTNFSNIGTWQSFLESHNISFRKTVYLPLRKELVFLTIKYTLHISTKSTDLTNFNYKYLQA